MAGTNTSSAQSESAIDPKQRREADGGARGVGARKHGAIKQTRKRVGSAPVSHASSEGALLELQEPGVLPLAFPLPLAYRPFFKAFGSRRRVGSLSKSGSGELSDRESLPAAAGDAADLRPHAAS